MASVRELDTSAARMRIALQSIGIRSANELPDAFSAMTKGRIEAIIVVGGPLMFAERKRIAELANKQRLPAMYSATEYAEAGGLMSYAPSYRDLFRRAGVFVNRILKGANPAELPIEQPTTFELVINSITARELGIVIPPAMLARADRVIR